ncbi:MAG: glycosyltransferase, partial [Planctomycetota bacterium]|nr:glycosyltransferase [Planctomycetota bacterium]
MTDSGQPDKPARIAFCITELRVGGAEKCLVQLATRLDRQRFTPAVISLAPQPPPEQSQLVHRLVDAGIQPQFLDIDRPSQFFQAIGKLAACLADLQPDLLQTFLFHADVVGARAARRQDNLLHVAGLRVADPRSRLRHCARRWLTRSTARYVCVSRDVAEFAAGQMRLPRDKLTVIPNGIDVAHYATAAPLDLGRIGVPAGRKILLYVGRLDPQKRPDRLIDIMQRLQQQPPCHLILVGSGPQHGRLKQQVADSNLGDYVHFAGWQPNVEQFLAAADMLLLTSAWEGMPNVVLEAMAAGKPVVSCDCQGVRELLGDGADQQRADQQTVPCEVVDQPARLVEQFAARIQQIATDDQLAAELSRANQQRALERFSLEKMAQAYQRLYVSLLAI